MTASMLLPTLATIPMVMVMAMPIVMVMAMVMAMVTMMTRDGDDA